MTPKEKAEDLFNKYCLAIKTDETDSGYFTNVLYAKQCALIAVDEIILEMNNVMLPNPFKQYWNEVKQEIEKL
jgi:hypothetical protein